MIEIFHGVLVGCAYGLFSWLKSSAKDGRIERFEMDRFPLSLVMGAMAGGVLGYLGRPLDFGSIETMVMTLSEYAGLTFVLDALSKTIWRRLGLGKKIKSLF